MYAVSQVTISFIAHTFHFKSLPLNSKYEDFYTNGVNSKPGPPSKTF
jgi:hypothetical protein